MSGKNLLVVFGGTDEGSNVGQLDTGFDDANGNRIKASNTVQSVFDEQALDEQDTDLLQFNFITEKPSVSFREAGSSVGSPGPDIEVDPLLRGTSKDAVPQKTGNEAFDGKMRELELFLEQTAWVDRGVDFNTGVRGMTADTYRNFSDRARDVIFSYINDIRGGENYDNIIVMGHSRGAGLATRAANAVYEEYPDQFLRLVLQDPVSKNAKPIGEVDADTVVISESREYVKKLADAGKEVHIIAKTYLRSGDLTDSSIFNYETYAPELMGTHFFYPGDERATLLLGETTSREAENRITDSVGNEPDMRNVYFHLAHMQHGYMLQGPNGYDNKDDANYKAFHSGFGAYENIIKTDPWTTTHSNGEAIDIDQLAAESETLQKYIKGERKATEPGKLITNFLGYPTGYEPNLLPDGDPLGQYYQNNNPDNRIISVNMTAQGQDRQHALVHSLAYKVLIPTINIEVSATEANEADASEIVITATSNRTFENDQTVTLQFPQDSSGSTATLGDDYTLSGFEQSGDNYTITIDAGSNTGTGTIKIEDDDQIEEETEKVSFSIIKDGVLNKTSNLGEIKGINGTTQNIEITIIENDLEPPEIQIELGEEDQKTASGSSDGESEDPAPPASVPPIEVESEEEDPAPPASVPPIEVESGQEETFPTIANFQVPVFDLDPLPDGPEMTETSPEGESEPEAESLPNIVTDIYTPPIRIVFPMMFSANISTSNTEADDTDNAIAGTPETDDLFGLDGEDNIAAGNGDDEANGNRGNDTIDGGSGNDEIQGGKGNDQIQGGDGNDILFGNLGDDTIAGNADNDWINGNQGQDLIDGGDGDDEIYGGQDDDQMKGSDGNDTLSGNLGADQMEGNEGDDWLYGGQGNDTLSGNAGGDRLYGDLGADLLDGGEGADTLTGGEGSDRFILVSGFGVDTITDFSDGEDLMILDGGPTFEDLTINAVGGDAEIRVGSEILARLTGVDAEMLTVDDFTALEV
ncbi:MAG: hypothetical protein ACP5D7_06165 [Limnospira sp.]